jgi:hypothetical protein
VLWLLKICENTVTGSVAFESRDGTRRSCIQYNDAGYHSMRKEQSDVES